MVPLWWATLESNQACVSARELQSPATPCGLSPTEPVGEPVRGVGYRRAATRSTKKPQSNAHNQRQS